MNEQYKTSKFFGLIALVLIFTALTIGVYVISQQKPIYVPPRAQELPPVDTIPHLFFRAVDDSTRNEGTNISLMPGKHFALWIMLSRVSSLEQDKKYKFKLKFDYNGKIFDVRKPHDSKLNDSEKVNGDIISMDTVFDEMALDKVEEKELDDADKKPAGTRAIEIEGYFKSSDFASLNTDQQPPEKKDRMVIISLKQFQVKSDADLSNLNTHLLYWYRDDTKIERVDSALGVGFINPNNELKLEMVDKDVMDFPTGEKVVPEPGSDITKPLGEIKATPTIVIPGQTTQTTGTTGATTLNLSLKFQGILKKPDAQYNTMLVKVGIGGGSSASPISSQTGTFTANDAGVWSGSVTFPALAAISNYRILVKGPKHLQKRICDTNPSETYPGSYTCSDGKISLQAGVNTLDFSKVYQLAGDLPEQNGVQNGFTNSYDTSLIRNNLNSADPTILKFADLNLDGIVNTQDFSLVIAALEFRSDEQ